MRRIEAVEDTDEGRAPRRRLGQVEARGKVVGVVTQVDLDDAVRGAHAHPRADRDPVRGRSRQRIVCREGRGLGLWQAADRGRDPALRVVEPLLVERLERVPADLLCQRPRLTLADSRGADHREVVAVPLLGHADAHHAHADDVVDVLAVSLHLHAGEDQGALLVDVLRLGVVRRRDRVARIGLVRLADHRVAVRLRLVENRNEDDVIGGVGVAVVGGVVQERVARPQVGVHLDHRLAERVCAHHVDGKALRVDEQVVGAGRDAAGEVARAVQDAGASGSKQRVAHLARDTFEARRKDGQLGSAQRWQAHG